MTSSDSGEDFESADDDFDDDFTTHKTTLAEIKGPLFSHMDDESLTKVESLNKICPNKGEKCGPLHSDNTVFVENKNKDLTTNKSFKTNISNELEQIPPQTIGIGLIVNPKIGSRIGSDVNFHSATCDLEAKPIIAVKIDECEKLLRNEKLCPEGVKERILNEEPDLEKLQVGDGWDIEEDDGFKIPDTLVKTVDDLTEKPAKELGCEHDLENLKVGDGWDIEEDNGFEIPVTLAKPSAKTSDASTEMQSFNDRKLTEKLHKEQEYENQGWGGWGGWGVSSLLSTATGSVSTFSSQVTAGLSTVMETTVGAPDPETLAAASVQNRTDDDGIEEKPTVEENPSSSSYGGFGSIVSGVSFLGSTVINRGLDTLESLGKKTMEVLQEGDPGLMKKRAILFPNQDKPVLSQILREAKEKADHSDKEKEEKETARKAHFESLFDDFQGMVHLEALEMLSTQCSLKLQTQLQSQTGCELEDLQETLSQVQELCELQEDDDEAEALSHEEFNEQITKCIDGLKINISATKIIQVNDGVIGRLSELQSAEGPASFVNQAAISSLAEFTAAAMECFHKSAELLLAKKLHNTADEAENYIQFTNHLCARVSAIANDFSQLLTKNHPISNSSLITNIFLEASNSSSYIKNACQLLVPILQVGAVSS